MARRDDIPGGAGTAARAIIAEIGLDLSRFPSAAHLASGARFAPGGRESADKQHGTGATGHGNPYLARVLGEAAVGASHTEPFLGERYRRIARRRGKKKAVVAVGRSILIIVWHLLADEQATFAGPGPEHYASRVGSQRAVRSHLRALPALGYRVTLTPAA